MCSVRPVLRFVARALAGDHDVDAVIAEDALQLADVGETRHVVEDQRVLGQQAGDHQRQSGVLGARNRDGAVQPLAADDANTIHDAPLLSPLEPDPLRLNDSTILTICLRMIWIMRWPPGAGPLLWPVWGRPAKVNFTRVSGEWGRNFRSFPRQRESRPIRRDSATFGPWVPVFAGTNGRWAGLLGPPARLRLAALEVVAQRRLQPLGTLPLAGFAGLVRHGAQWPPGTKGRRQRMPSAASTGRA